MSRPVVCDVCGGKIQWLSWTRKWRVMRVNSDLMLGTSKSKMDICDVCWDRVHMIIKKFEADNAE